MTQDNNISEEAVNRVILASAPEREQEFIALWASYKPQIHFTEDRRGFTLETAYGFILFNHITMCKIWLLGFSAQRALHAYSSLLVNSQLFGIELSTEVFAENQEHNVFSVECQSLLSDIDNLVKTESIDHFVWPVGVPYPNQGKPCDIDGSMVFDLLCMGAAYFFLHELKHVIFERDGAILHPHDEEMQCDAFARDFLLSKIEDYSRNSGYPANAVKTKRAISIALVSVLFLVITPIDRWKGSDSHPPVIDRITALTDYLDIRDNNYFWLYLSCLLLAQMERKGLRFQSQVIDNQKEFCLAILQQLEQTSNKWANRDVSR